MNEIGDWSEEGAEQLVEACNQRFDRELLKLTRDSGCARETLCIIETVWCLYVCNHSPLASKSLDQAPSSPKLNCSATLGLLLFIHTKERKAALVIL